MKDEIKEILSLLNSSSWSNEAEKIEDYITNLQQAIEVKNERIKEEQQEKERYIKFYNELNIWNKELQQENERLKVKTKEQSLLLIDYQDMEQRYNDYKSRCEKANEYMQDFIFEPLLVQEDRKLIMFNENLRNFENILQNGSDDNE